VSLILPPGESITLDRLCGDWKIHQLKGGHRFSADDLLTAWMASEAAPRAARQLDLGAGIGSVGLLSLWRLSATATLTQIEAQALSHELCRMTVALNGLGDRVRSRLGDLRDPAMLPPEEHGSYDLVTGSPPYIPLGKGVVSPHPQRAACRMELRGDIADYAATAARALAPDGTFVFCHAAGDPRPEAAIAQAGLRLLARQDVFFRQRLPPTIALFRCGWRGERDDPAPFVIRDAAGDWTEAYLALRAQMGGPPNLQRET
jgi:tRNA1(Val) A37 N6-methylase TrmN6